jgi:hypothetical protein
MRRTSSVRILEGRDFVPMGLVMFGVPVKLDVVLELTGLVSRILIDVVYHGKGELWLASWKMMEAGGSGLCCWVWGSSRFLDVLGCLDDICFISS